MKKVLLMMILAAGFQQLKAQQTFKTVPEMKLSDGLNGNAFKPQTDNLFKPNADSLSAVKKLLNPNAIVVYSKMPVVKITRSNIDHMPIYNPAQSNMHYDMLIKKVEVNPVEPIEKVAP